MTARSRWARPVAAAALAWAILFPGRLAAQNPLASLPGVYTLEFENPWARVIRVRYQPQTTLPEHDHTDWAAAFVYLSDSGPVIFRHSGPAYTDVTRPPTRSGGFRLNKSYLPNRETHQVVNASDLASEFLRVEFKTVPLDADTLRGRYPPLPIPPGRTFERRQFENRQLRVTRLAWEPGRSITIKTSRHEPSLIVMLTPATLRLERPVASRLDLRAGQVYWMDARWRQRLTNAGTSLVQALRFDLRTKPCVGEACIPTVPATTAAPDRQVKPSFREGATPGATSR